MSVGQERRSTRVAKTLASLRRIIVVALFTYIGVCVLLGFLQARLIYFPSHEYVATPKDMGLDYEELTLHTSDNVAIGAWYIGHPNAVGTVLFCHGNAGNISDRLLSIKLLHRLACNVLIFDYRGYGRSEGRPSERGTYLDAEAAYSYLVDVRGESPGSLVYFGRSLGGAVAIELASRHTPGALVVESTFTSLEDIGKLHYPLLPIRWLLSYRYNSIEKVPMLGCPKLFFHGRDDELIPTANGKRLFDAAAGPKEFIETPGGHNESGFTHSPEYTDVLARFLDQALKSPG